MAENQAGKLIPAFYRIISAMIRIICASNGNLTSQLIEVLISTVSLQQNNSQ